MRKAANILKITVLFTIFYIGLSSFCFASTLKIKGDKFYLDGSPFFINAVGYAPWRPGQWPGTDKVDPKIVEYDFKMIKEAGFNSIRTWEALEEKELALALKHNLYVIQGIWIDPNHDFSDRQWQDMQIDRIKEVVSYSKRFPNVLFYLIITEPTTKAVLYTGEDETKEFFKRIINTVHKIDKRFVSMDSWIPLGFLDHSMWDIVTFNAFMFTPESINKVLGFEGYVRFIKENYAKDKPLFIGETGGFSVSEKRTGTLSFGGNTEEEQSRGNIDSIKACINAGAAGVCTVSWIDTWHYPGEPDVHNNEPWEWDGIIALEDKDNPYGKPRRVFYDLKEFNKGLTVKRSRQLQEDNQSQLIIEPTKKIFSPNEKIRIIIKALYKGRPLAEKKIRYGFFTQQGWKEYNIEAVSDKNGIVYADCNLDVDSTTGYVIAFASLDDEKYRASDLKFIKVAFKKENSSYFWIYKDKDFPGNHYIQSGWIGDHSGLKFEDRYIDKTDSTDTSIRITYTPQKDGAGWAGIFWQNPVNNWGDKQGGYNLTGKKELVFSAKGKRGGEVIADFISGCTQSGNYPDSSYLRIGPMVLTEEWKQYSIDLKNKDLSYISGGFGFIVKEKDNPKGCTFYIDEIYYK